MAAAPPVAAAAPAAPADKTGADEGGPVVLQGLVRLCSGWTPLDLVI